MTHQERIVYGGVDTHQDVHVGAVIDSTGRLLGTKAYPTTPIGLRGMLRWMTGQGTVAMVGVEGTGTYGLGLQRVLQHAGLTVIEVNRPTRQLRRTRGKSDTVDAEAAARAVLARHATVVPKSRDGIVESIRVLRIALESSRRSRVRVGAQIRHLVLTAPERLHLELAPLPLAEQAARAARFRPGDDTADVLTATRAALRVLARQYQSLTADMDLLSAELDTLTMRANPGLRQLRGVGPDTAAALLVAAGDNPERLTSDAGFAALCGASPVEASSGKITGHRLNRGGNRQANAALHRIVVGRMGHHQPTKDYIARRTAQGKSKKSIMRCLKRYVAREVYSHLVNPRPAEITDDLRPRRTALNIPIRVVALAVGENAMTISRLERGLGHDAELTRRYHTWITAQEAA